MLNVIKHIICELTGYRPGAVDVSQGDRQSRAVSCRLLESGAPWMIPEGATARVAYTLPDGTEGLYDSRTDGTPMWEISGNIVTVELADQLMAQAGMAQVSILVMGPDGGQLAAWPIRVNVIADKAALLTVPEKLPPFGAGFAGKLFYGDENGNISPLRVGNGLEVEDGELSANGGGGNESRKPVYYIATDYGISTEADDNTPALQALIDRLHDEGGGVIWFPVGTYRFRRGGADADGKEFAVVPRSNVSIVGESMVGTIMKQVDPVPYGMFTRRATADDPLYGCHFERFTVDAYDTGNVNQVYGKAFHAKYVRNCSFRDLRLMGTTATAMGIDFLDQVIIDNVTCIDCGRTWTGSEPGTSGIGIGTGGWQNENFVISNCVTVGCGQFGIFVENQTNLFGFDGCEYSKGVVISNCVVRNGLNHGIGIRGGADVTVIGCESYENAGNGVYLDNKCRNVHIMSVSATDNGGHGIRLNPDGESGGIYVQGCNAVGNNSNGIRVSASCDALTIQGCTTRDNAMGLSIKEGLILNDAVILGNAFLDGWELPEDVFTGNTQYIDGESGEAVNRIALTEGDLTSGLKLNQDGSEGASDSGKVSGYLDVSGMGSPITITTDGNTDSVRVAQYGANRVSLVTNAALSDIAGDGVHELTVEKLQGCAYIRLFYSSLDGTNPAVIRSILVEGEESGNSGENVTIDVTLTQSGQAADAKATGDRISALEATVEPAEGDIPIFYFGGPLAKTKDDIVMPFEYRSKTATYKGYVKTKAAGNSSMEFPKKNQNVKLYKDSACEEKLKISFNGWPKTHKYRVNANWIDITHSRNIVTCRLWADTVRSRPDFDQLPELLRTSPNLGTIDGFPILVYADGVYQGRYTLNIPKDAYMANMDDKLDEHCILYGENYSSGWFRDYAKIDGTDWTDEVHDVAPASIVTRWNEAIDFVMNSSDDDFRANLSNYFDIASIIDYLCVGLASCDYDGFGKNQQYLTYNGQLWYANAYDKDSTWLLMFTGQGFLPADYLNFLREDGNLLYGRLSNIFIQEIQSRWPVLRSGPLSFENIVSRFEQFIRICPPHIVAEDYAETTGGGAFTTIPSQTTNNIQQIRAAVKARLAFCDEFVANLDPFVPVPCTSITLDKAVLTFDKLTTQTLTATIVPEDCTESVTWESDNEEVATVKNGVITPIADGSANITVRCGEQSATCAITVSGVMGNIMSGVTWSLGTIQDNGNIATSTNTVVTDPFDIADYAGQNLIVEYSKYAAYHQRNAFYDSADTMLSLERSQLTALRDEFTSVPASAATMRIMMTGELGATVALKTETTEDIGFSELEQIPGNINVNTGELGAQQYNGMTCYVPVTPGAEYKVSAMFAAATYDADMKYVGNPNLRANTALFKCPEGVAYLGVTGNNPARTVERIVAKTTIGSATFSGL